ncbi:hypothetical protein BDAP_000959 [Binucleata daphniae]
MKDDENTLLIIEILTALLTFILIFILHRYLKKRKLKKLKPDKQELERAIKELENATEPMLFLEKLIQKYSTINVEEKCKKSKVFAPVLFKHANKLFLQKNNCLNMRNYKIIGILLQNEFPKHVMYAVIRNLLIKLILNEDFDFDKYKNLYCGYYTIEDYDACHLASQKIDKYTKIADDEFDDIKYLL